MSRFRALEALSFIHSLIYATLLAFALSDGFRYRRSEP